MDVDVILEKNVIKHGSYNKFEFKKTFVSTANTCSPLRKIPKYPLCVPLNFALSVVSSFSRDSQRSREKTKTIWGDKQRV